jgi:predicted transcriptional regulator
MSQEPKAPASAVVDLDELAELERRWAAIEAGEATVPHDEVVQWLETWGTPAFRPWCDR